MIIEATETLQVEARQVVRYLKEHPTVVGKITRHLIVPEKIQDIGVHLLAPTFDDLLASREGKLTFGFLTNDAINLAVIKRHHLMHMATNDPDFERMESLKVWRPAPASPSGGVSSAV
jgi:predicted nucleic acid-binding protein